MEIDLRQWENKLKHLSEREMRTVFRGAVRKGAAVLRKGVVEEFRSMVRDERSKRTVMIGGSEKTYGYMYKDIELSMYRKGYRARVSLYDKRKKDNRAYILRILNQGSKVRKFKKAHRANLGGRYAVVKDSGKVEAWKFFEKGVQKKGQEAVNTVTQVINREIAMRGN